ncbi:MAG: putative quinol monooxygenase [Pseudomonadota bacterium]
MYCIFATIYPKHEHFDEAKSAILSILEKTRAEAGCIQFDAHTDEEQTKLFLYEQWENEAALHLHYEQEYTKEIFNAYEAWLEKPVEISNLQFLEA